MTQAQALALGLAALAAILLAWRRVPSELAALAVLVLGVLAGVIPAAGAFVGFGSAAVVTVAATMLVSTTVARSGAVETLVRPLLRRAGSERARVTVLAGAVAGLSAAAARSGGALATLLPFAAQVAARTRSSSQALIAPMMLAAKVGGLLTLVGSIPNIIVADQRARLTGAPFALFDFAPVGLGLAGAGLALLWFGYRFLPSRPAAAGLDASLHARALTAEARVPADSPFVGRPVAELEAVVGGGGLRVGLIVRERFRRVEPSPDERLRDDDALLLCGQPDDIERLISIAGLVLEDGDEAIDADDAVREGVVTTGSPLVGMKPDDAHVRVRHRLRVLAIGRRDAAVTRRLRFVRLQVGDVLILKGPREHLAEAMEALQILPLSERPVALGARRRSWAPGAVLVAAATLVVLGVAPVAVAFTAAAVAVLALRATTLDEAYRTMDWSVVVLIGALVPLADAVTASGGASLVAGALSRVAAPLPPAGALGLMLALAMALSSLAGGAFGALMLAPVAVALAGQVGPPTDALLMAVAVGAGCGVLDPRGEIGARGPAAAQARYRAADYQWLTLPLALLVLVAGTALIALVWGVGGR